MYQDHHSKAFNAKQKPLLALKRKMSVHTHHSCSKSGSIHELYLSLCWGLTTWEHFHV